MQNVTVAETGGATAAFTNTMTPGKPLQPRKKHAFRRFVEQGMPWVITAGIVSAVTSFLLKSRFEPNGSTNQAAGAKPGTGETAAERRTASSTTAVTPAPAVPDPAASTATDPRSASTTPMPSDPSGPAVAVSPKSEPAADQPAAEPQPQADGTSELDRQVEKLFPMPVFKPLLELVNDWKTVPVNALPPEIILKVPLTFRLDAGGQVSLPVGAQVFPVRYDGGTLTVTNAQGSKLQATVAVDDTDFKDSVTKRYHRSVEQAQQNVLARRVAEKKRLGKLQAHELAMSQYGDGNDPRFEPMKASIRSGGAGFFQLEAAHSWRWSGKETVDGTEYETGMVIMAMESAFGTARRELKALMRDGKVVRWLDAATGKPL